jgi:hypothetical protein
MIMLPVIQHVAACSQVILYSMGLEGGLQLFACLQESGQASAGRTLTLVPAAAGGAVAPDAGSSATLITIRLC